MGKLNKSPYIEHDSPKTVEQYKARLLAALLTVNPVLDLSQVTITIDWEAETPVRFEGVDSQTFSNAYELLLKTTSLTD